MGVRENEVRPNEEPGAPPRARLDRHDRGKHTCDDIFERSRTRRRADGWLAGPEFRAASYLRLRDGRGVCEWIDYFCRLNLRLPIFGLLYQVQLGTRNGGVRIGFGRLSPRERQSGNRQAQKQPYKKGSSSGPAGLCLSLKPCFRSSALWFFGARNDGPGGAAPAFLNPQRYLAATRGATPNVGAGKAHMSRVRDLPGYRAGLPGASDRAGGGGPAPGDACRRRQ